MEGYLSLYGGKDVNKIILKDKTELKIEEGATGGCIAVVTEDLTIIDAYVKSLTKENLSHAEVIDENEEVVLILKDKKFSSFDGTQVEGEENYIVCFRLDDVYTLEEKIARLEEENAKLSEAMNELLGV